MRIRLFKKSGFRGYMMPKLMKLFGTGKAAIVGGTIWGLWHLPLICMGQNFGTEYPGYPFLGILLMTVNCICAGSVLTFLTIKSKSIWPAAVMHAVNNRIDAHIERINCHPMEIRRYYRRLNY